MKPSKERPYYIVKLGTGEYNSDQTLFIKKAMQIFNEVLHTKGFKWITPISSFANSVKIDIIKNTYEFCPDPRYYDENFSYRTIYDLDAVNWFIKDFDKLCIKMKLENLLDAAN